MRVTASVRCSGLEMVPWGLTIFRVKGTRISFHAVDARMVGHLPGTEEYSGFESRRRLQFRPLGT